MKNVLVIGWYNHNNIGDQLFIEAFHELFPQYNFTFTDIITKKLLNNADVVFFGGGSFLDAAPIMEPHTIFDLCKKPIFYIGIGAETTIDPVHINLMRRAKLIALRSFSNLDKIKTINENVIVIPDIIFSLQDKVKFNTKIDKSILVIPNISVVPKWNDEHWKHVAWEYFKSEFSQFLDYLIEQDYQINFFPMCQNIEMDDSWAAIEIINQMKYRNVKYNILHQLKNISSITSIFSKYQTIISQRYHGAVLSEMINTPCIVISHHDKLKSAGNENISFYGLTKIQLINQFNKIIFEKKENILPIENNSYSDLKQRISTLIE